MSETQWLHQNRWTELHSFLEPPVLVNAITQIQILMSKNCQMIVNCESQNIIIIMIILDKNGGTANTLAFPSQRCKNNVFSSKTYFFTFLHHFQSYKDYEDDGP